MNSSSDHFDMAAAPLRIATVTLKVRDLARMSAFYRDIIGLTVIEGDTGRVVLGVDGRALVILTGDPALALPDPRQAGLFHTAFLLPGRADLGRWLAHAAQSDVRLQGASDHIVSEALYLADPEGNGIEVYADRPVAAWQTKSGVVRMATDPLDLDELLRSAGETRWQGFPAGGCIGHVHLQVGDTDVADRFYRDILGFDIATRYPGASFYGSGGYHHQLAGNIWNSRGAGARPDGMAGLAEVEIAVREADTLAAIAGRADASGLAVENGAAALTLHDPWGTRLALAR